MSFKFHKLYKLQTVRNTFVYWKETALPCTVSPLNRIEVRYNDNITGLAGARFVNTEATFRGIPKQDKYYSVRSPDYCKDISMTYEDAFSYGLYFGFVVLLINNDLFANEDDQVADVAYYRKFIHNVSMVRSIKLIKLSKNQLISPYDAGRFHKIYTTYKERLAHATKNCNL